MKKRFSVLILIFFCALTTISAQSDSQEKADKLYKKYSAQAKEEKEKGNFAQAEVLYRKALSKKPDGDAATFNFGNLYFENQKKQHSALRYVESVKKSEDKTVKHKNFHNIGNLYMEQEKYSEAVEAYKNALRNNPNDEETRYNLALAKQKREKEKNDGGGDGQNKDQEQKKEDKSQDKNKGGKGDQEKKEDKKQDSQDGKDEKESEKKKDDAKKNPKEGQNEKQKQPSKPQKGKMSEQQIKNLLQAIQNKEKDTQEKLNSKKVKGVKVKTEKDW